MTTAWEKRFSCFHSSVITPFASIAFDIEGGQTTSLTLFSPYQMTFSPYGKYSKPVLPPSPCCFSLQPTLESVCWCRGDQRSKVNIPETSALLTLWSGLATPLLLPPTQPSVCQPATPPFNINQQITGPALAPPPSPCTPSPPALAWSAQAAWLAPPSASASPSRPPPSSSLSATPPPSAPPQPLPPRPLSAGVEIWPPFPPPPRSPLPCAVATVAASAALSASVLSARSAWPGPSASSSSSAWQWTDTEEEDKKKKVRGERGKKRVKRSRSWGG